jgi:3-deoxy-manno-octulosonate cytidylyltransferase (CMP-KDO synthetase)
VNSGGGPQKPGVQRSPVVAIIPARMASSRFPGKILADRTGKPLIRHVWEAALQAACVDRVIVATDDERILDAVAAFGGECVLTSPDHESGTSRLAEAAGILGLSSDTVVVNVQGDEPEVEPAWIDAAVNALRAGSAPVGTVAVPFSADEDPCDPNLVKVVLQRNSSALYFSRSLVPFVRQGAMAAAPPLKHLGLYTYRRPFLDTYITLEPTVLERTEMLEQLRVLFYGYGISVAVCQGRSYGGIDTPEQYEAFVRRQQRPVSARA